MRTVLITGASQGIGAAVARAFASDPSPSTLLLVSRSADKLEAIEAECRDFGAEAIAFPCDVTDEAAVEKLGAEVANQVGAIDILINNAGQFEPGAFLDTSVDSFRAQLEVNLTSAFLVTRAFLPAMLERKTGRIVMIGSVASVKGYPGGAAYGAAKHGLLGLARTLREETLGSGVGITTLLPGATLTPSWDGVDVPAERLMPPEDIAKLVVGVTSLSPRTVVEELLVRPAEGDL